MRPVDIAVGDTFGRWTVLSLIATRQGRNGDRYLPVRCICGTIGDAPIAKLRAGQSQSCGCLRRDSMRERAQARVTINVGNKFGRWVVLSTKTVRQGSRGDRYLSVRCICGTLGEVTITNLHRGRSLSCGCLRRERVSDARRTHGESRCSQDKTKGTREYGCWHRMLTRCSNINDKNYGGRGITVCRRWRKYENFLFDMGRCPPKMTLDRRNNNKGYTPTNCRWATPKEQARNRRDTVLLTYKGVTRSLAEWAEYLNVSRMTLYTRYAKGWPTASILDTNNQQSPLRLLRCHGDS